MVNELKPFWTLLVIWISFTICYKKASCFSLPSSFPPSLLPLFGLSLPSCRIKAGVLSALGKHSDTRLYFQTFPNNLYCFIGMYHALGICPQLNGKITCVFLFYDLLFYTFDDIINNMQITIHSSFIQAKFFVVWITFKKNLNPIK